jgi:enediyne biosynthesis thioesterase
MPAPWYEFRHVVGFEETNLVGNVYYVNHLRWQGRCREMFLREHAPGVLAMLSGDFALATVRCACEYFAELRAFDEVAVRMKLQSIVQHRIAVEFEYWRTSPGEELLVARGTHEVACMRRQGERMVPTGVPAELRAALRPYEAGGA